MSVIWCVSVRIISAVRARARAARDGLSSYRWCMAGRGRLDCTQGEQRGALCFLLLSGAVRLWASGNRQLLATMHSHTGLVWSVAPSADGGRVASVTGLEGVAGAPGHFLQHEGVAVGVA